MGSWAAPPATAGAAGWPAPNDRAPAAVPVPPKDRPVDAVPRPPVPRAGVAPNVVPVPKLLPSPKPVWAPKIPPGLASVELGAAENMEPVWPNPLNAVPAALAGAPNVRPVVAGFAPKAGAAAVAPVNNPVPVPAVVN